MSLDSASKARLRTAYPDLAIRAIRFEQDVWRIVQMQIRITEVIRTMEYQQQLYQRGRELKNGVWLVVDKKKRVTNAKPGESIHHYGLAFDICFAGKDPYLEEIRKTKPQHWAFLWREVGRIGQAHGLIWGYDWNGNGLVDGNDFDRPHFELTYGLRLRDIREPYQFGGIASVWAKLDQIRKVPEGSEWNGILSKQRLLDAGILA